MNEPTQFDVNYVIYGEDVAILLSATCIREPDSVSRPVVVKEETVIEEGSARAMGQSFEEIVKLNPRVHLERLPDDLVNARVVVDRLPDSVIDRWTGAVRPPAEARALGDPDSTEVERRAQYCDFLKSDYGLECPVCDKRFDARYKIARHVKEVHLKIRNHTCELCNRAFSSLSHKRGHMEAIHYKTNHFQCNFCQASFSCDRYMKMHTKRYHSDPTSQCAVTLNACNYCLQQFSTRDDLNTHLRFHGIFIPPSEEPPSAEPSFLRSILAESPRMIISTSIPASAWLAMPSTSAPEPTDGDEPEYAIDICDSVTVRTDEIMALTLDDLKVALQKIDLGLSIFDRSDPNRERSLRVRRQVNDAVRCYRDIKRRLNLKLS